MESMDLKTELVNGIISNDIKNDVLQSNLEIDPDFVYKLAFYVRSVYKDIDSAIMLLAYCAHNEKAKTKLRRWMSKIIQSPEEVVDLMSVYLDTFGKPIPNSLKRGLADVLSNFWHFPHYSNNGVSYKTVLKLIHPKPLNETRAVTYKCILDNKLDKSFKSKKKSRPIPSGVNVPKLVSIVNDYL